ncbi:hypothetical protein [Vibrio phage vB_VpS_CA8]|nr:hypothetical protein [Vibrio phage vB_VpS_CA8]QEQ95144.1 hypothetical protein [Vibrio phage vB_VpS_BA3]
MIRVYKRNWFGMLKCIAEFSDTYYRIVVSTGGVLTIRAADHRETTILALEPKEWSIAKVEDK